MLLLLCNFVIYVFAVVLIFFETLCKTLKSRLYLIFKYLMLFGIVAIGSICPDIIINTSLLDIILHSI